MLFGRKAKNEHYFVVLEPIHRWQGAPGEKKKVPRGLRSDLQEPERKEGLVLYAADLVITTLAYYKITWAKESMELVPSLLPSPNSYSLSFALAEPFHGLYNLVRLFQIKVFP